MILLGKDTKTTFFNSVVLWNFNSRILLFNGVLAAENVRAVIWLPLWFARAQ